MKGTDLTGQVYGRLTVLGLADHPKRRWVGQCSCGDQKILSSSTWGRIKSCGCLRRENGFKRGSNSDQIKNRILHFLASGPKSCRAVKAELKTGYEHYLRQLIKDGRVTKKGSFRKAVYRRTRIKSGEIQKRTGDENSYRLAREWAKTQRTDALEELLPFHDLESAKTVRRALEDELEYRRLSREHHAVDYDN
jgi:hypothetical protein